MKFNWKVPLLTFSIFSVCLYSFVSYFKQETEEPFDLLSIPGKDRSFVFIITAKNAENHCTKTLSSILEQSYRNFYIYYIDDASTDKTYEVTKTFIDKFYPNAPISLIKNTTSKGALHNAYEKIQGCKNYKVIALLDGNCYFPNKDVLKNFNDLYKVNKVWLAYGQHFNASTNQKGGCRLAPPLSFFPSMRKRYWEKPYFKTFYAGLFQKVKLEDFFYKGKFIDEECDSAYMFPMMELAKDNIGFIEETSCHYLGTPPPNSNLTKSCKKWICKASPYTPLKKHPGAVKRAFNKNRTADLIIFSYDRPLHLFAVIESIYRYMSGINSISVIYRASDEQNFNAYNNVSHFFKNVKFIKQSNWPEKDFKSLAIQAVFHKSIDASPYVIFSADDILVNAPVDISDCIQTLKNTGAYCYALKLGCRTSYCCDKSIHSRIPHYVHVSENAIGWQINESRGDWTQANCIEMNLYRKIDLHKPLFSIDFKHTLELAKNWAKETKPYLRERRQRVGICFKNSKIINFPINEDSYNTDLYTSKKLLNLYEKGFKLDINNLENCSHSNYQPTFIPREIASTLDIKDKKKPKLRHF